MPDRASGEFGEILAGSMKLKYRSDLLQGCSDPPPPPPSRTHTQSEQSSGFTCCDQFPCSTISPPRSFLTGCRVSIHFSRCSPRPRLRAQENAIRREAENVKTQGKVRQTMGSLILLKHRGQIIFRAAPSCQPATSNLKAMTRANPTARHGGRYDESSNLSQASSAD